MESTARSDIDLAGVQAKLDRADEHVRELDRAVNAFLNNENYRFVGEAYMEGGYEHRVIYLEIQEFPPDEQWGPIIGDAVHNLRSALEHLAWQIAKPEARAENPRGIEFPIFLDNPEDDPERRRLFKRKLNRLRPEFHAVIERAQPYKTGDSHHPLWLLDTLWNTDKHRTLHTASFMYSRDPDDPANPFGYASWGSVPLNRSEHRTEMVRMSGFFNETLEEQVDANQAMAHDIALGKPADPPSDVPWPRDYPFAGLPLRQVLRRIRTYVETEVLAPLRSIG